MSFRELWRSKIIRFKNIDNLFKAGIKGDDKKSNEHSTIIWQSLWGYALTDVLEGVGAEINLKEDSVTFYLYDEPNQCLKQCICLPNSEWEFELQRLPELVQIWFPYVYSKTLTEPGKKSLDLLDKKGNKNRLLIIKLDGNSYNEQAYQISTYTLGNTYIGGESITISWNSKTKEETMRFKGF